MPGPQVCDWDKYHALRREGWSPKKAAMITNSQCDEGKKKSDDKQKK